MKDPKFQKEFVKDTPEFKRKNIQGIFKSKPAPAAPMYSKFYAKSRTILVDKFKEYASGKKDVNTALREAEDLINTYIKTGMP